MKKNIQLYDASPFRQLLCLLLLPLALSGCLFEQPEMTADGELGVDPTEVSVTADITLDMKLTELETTRLRARAATGGDAAYRHRFIVEAYMDDMATIRRVVYEDIRPDRTHLSVPVSMKLHARNYRLVVWADYVKAGSEADWFYNTEIMDPLIATEPYQANSEYKDAFHTVQTLDLSKYRDQWNAKVPVKLELVRPVARYELVATDAAAFLKKHVGTEGNFTARVKYSHYLPVGFDALSAVPRHSLMYMSYKKTFALPAGGTKDFTVGVDYVFMGDEKKEIPIEVEITDPQGVTVARTILLVPCRKGKQTTVRDNFLTADPSTADEGVGIDPDFDDEMDMEVGVM